MQEQLEPILLVLAVGSAVAIAATRIGVPYNVALVANEMARCRVRAARHGSWAA